MKQIIPPTNCPSCDSILVYRNDQLFCENPSCPAQWDKKVEHFASALKIKGLTAFQIWQIWRLLNYLRATGRYSYFGQNNNQARSTSDLSIDEAYKILGLKKGASRNEIEESARKLQRKIHPDAGNPNSEYLSKLVNSAKDLILKTDFS